MKKPDGNLITRCLAHVCREWTYGKKEWSCSKWFTWWYLQKEAVEIPENCQYSLVKNQAGQTQNRTNRGCLVNLP